MIFVSYTTLHLLHTITSSNIFINFILGLILFCFYFSFFYTYPDIYFYPFLIRWVQVLSYPWLNIVIYFVVFIIITKDGVHQQTHKSNVYNADQMKLLRTQDLAYVNMKRTQERNVLYILHIIYNKRI